MNSRSLLAIALLLGLAPAAPPAARAAVRLETSPAADVPPPMTTRPMNQRRFDFEDPSQGTITLAWEAVPGAKLYQVQLSRSEGFAELLNPSHQFVLGDGATSAELAGLPEGGYYWRVAAIDGKGRRGHWSRVTLFSVNEGPPPAADEGPQLQISSTTPVGDKAIVKGRTNTDGRLEAWVNGVPAGDVPIAGDGEFSVMLDANLIGKNVVRLIAVDKRGSVTYAETSFRYSGN